ncbi:MAG: hypothetical protein AB7O52_03045 [Planctomycetota bacterium]
MNRSLALVRVALVLAAALVASVSSTGWGSPPAARDDDYGPAPTEPMPVATDPEAATPWREKAYYVPYEQLDAIFEKTGRGVFVPYDEFLALWFEAQRKTPEPKAPRPPAGAVIRGGTYRGTVHQDLARFEVSFVAESLEEGWTEVALPLAGVAVEQATTTPSDALFVAQGNGYALFLPRPGTYAVDLRLSVPVKQDPGRKSLEFAIPRAAISRLELTIPEPEVRVEVQPLLAATQSIPGPGQTQVLAFLGNTDSVRVHWTPPPGRASEAGVVLSARQAIRTHLGERILRVQSQIELEVLRGEVEAFRVTLPANTRMLAAKGANLREWNQVGDTAVDLTLHAPVKDKYVLTLECERILEATPETLEVPFPRVEGVLRESGWFVLSQDPGLIVRTTASRGLSQVDPEEVPQSLRSALGLGFRYLAQPLSLTLAIEKIVPEVRGGSTSVVVLGREEDQWLGWIDYSISKAGLFRLGFRVPSGWDLDQIGHPGQIDEYQSTEEAGNLVVTLTTKTSVIGGFRVPFRLVREGNARPGELSLAPPEVLGAIQDRGLLGVSAPRAFEVVTIDREGLLDADVDELFRSGIMGQVSSEAGIPRAYRYRKVPATVKLRLDDKKTEIDVLAQHLVEVADGELRLTHFLDYDVRFAPVDSLRFVAPTALDTILQVEAKHKTQVRRVPGAAGLTEWIVSLQPPLIGAVTLTLTHPLDLQGLESGRALNHVVAIPHSSGVRSEKGFVAIRKEGTLEIVPTARNMEDIDASDLPDKLRRGQIYSAFRYFTADPSLELSLTRYDYEQLATGVVELLHQKAVLSEERQLKVQATLMVQNTDRQYLEVELAPSARILSLSVAGQSQAPKKRKDGSGTLIQIPRSSGVAFPIVVVYEESAASSAMGGFGFGAIRSLRVLDGVPVQQVELELFLPPEYTYLGWTGNLHPRDATDGVLWPRLKALLGLRGPETRAAPATAAAGATVAAAGIELDLPTGGYERRYFSTLAATGDLEFFYIGSRGFWLLDFLAFLVGVVGSMLLLTRVRAPRLVVGACALFATLMLSWFAQGPTATVLFTLFLGVSTVVAIFFLVHAVRWARSRRPTRVGPPADPFLENAAPAMPTPPRPEAGSSPEERG